jgi:palmitoyl-protein thioesterase
LADLNNVKPGKNMAYKAAIERLANFVMIMWEDDQTIIPPISSHMGFYQLGQDNITVPLQVNL